MNMENYILKNYFNSIIDHINEIDEILQGIGYEDFRTSRKIKINTVNIFLTIMEETINIPTELKETTPLFPWEKLNHLETKITDKESDASSELIWNFSKKEFKNIRMAANKLLKG